ncbi:DUF2959 domain-containing protein [Desulfogranum marinum]|jgi:hypothetical protein|uniref:DUF2959 domain-containing protein n=1 Tax=Desulfogranum marinum TaxID=453220 RepID=UPI001962A195|nr:DUF2959 domain-containing protein [Desulfogranum marinum]MBM9513729.1 DUF2959 domain-containing protein [Desulfogranum marinum]
MTRSFILSLFLLSLLASLSGCSSTYYNTLEKFGVHKRDVMVDRVGEARDAQEEAKQQFQSAFEQFSSVVEVKGGDLEEQYTVLKAEYDKSEKKAEAVHDRIAGVESVADALFDEWEKELDLYSSAALRRDSEQKLEQTQVQYKRLISAMKRAEEKIQPVLIVFHDQVLYLKHNLNARAIAALQGELVSLEKDVARLVREMETSIREADQFITKLQNG